MGASDAVPLFKRLLVVLALACTSVAQDTLPVPVVDLGAPEKPPIVAALQSAAAQPPRCPQSWWGKFTSEDCLFLSVYSPDGAKGRKLPVVVWIHGGGYNAGRASLYDGDDLIKQSNHGLVVVTIQYRLGLFGFLAGSAVKQDGQLNAGLLDQQFALRWVQEHISKFGGDPEKVAIWGESAGADSVLQHVIANGGRTSPPLFRAAITSSTYLPPQYPYDHRIPETLFSEVVKQTGSSGSSNVMSCLREASFDRLQAANVNINSDAFLGTFSFVPVVDGELIRTRPTLALANGTLNGEIVLVVTNAHEGTGFINQTMPANATQFAHSLFPDLPVVETAKVAALYSEDGTVTQLMQEDAILSESIFICPSYFILEAFHGRAYKAEFAIPPAYHAYDINYYWPTYAAPPYNNTEFVDARSTRRARPSLRRGAAGE
uniref:Carboxylic ester hydrolase n=1 Tax=Mycena chlorophos TaxID=658473 RepID=A0ABQ0M8F4_MYCCL|nr:predicted protein [Mycena chlorophos]